MIHKAASSSHASSARRSAASDKGFAEGIGDPQDAFLGGVQVKASITFENGISMADLAKCMTSKDDGTVTFDFSGIQGAKVTKNDR